MLAITPFTCNNQASTQTLATPVTASRCLHRSCLLSADAEWTNLDFHRLQQDLVAMYQVHCRLEGLQCVVYELAAQRLVRFRAEHLLIC